MKRMSYSIILLSCLAASTVSLADTLLIQRVQTGHTVDLPKRGSSMLQVEAKYGAPQQKFAAVGGGNAKTPPITRWQYTAFSVYFENTHVVNAVLSKASSEEIGPAPAKK